MPIGCGGVVVHPGDVLAASQEGVVVVPRRSMLAVTEALAQCSAASGQPGDDALRRLFELAQKAECDVLSDNNDW